MIDNSTCAIVGQDGILRRIVNPPLPLPPPSPPPGVIIESGLLFSSGRPRELRMDRNPGTSRRNLLRACFAAALPAPGPRPLAPAPWIPPVS
jgi:hypothetical protein